LKRVEVEIDGVVAQAELNEAVAPRATAALWDALPIEARLEHTKWSGRACGFRLPALTAVGELEHPVCSIYPGTLLARPDQGEVLISYGAAEYRSVLRAGIVDEEPRCRWRRTLLPFTPIGQSVLGHIDRRWLPHLVQANGFRACRRRRQIDRAGH